MIPDKTVKTINPRYAGASAEDVARALLRPLPTARPRYSTPGLEALRKVEIDPQAWLADVLARTVRKLLTIVNAFACPMAVRRLQISTSAGHGRKYYDRSRWRRSRTMSSGHEPATGRPSLPYSSTIVLPCLRSA